MKKYIIFGLISLIFSFWSYHSADIFASLPASNLDQKWEYLKVAIFYRDLFHYSFIAGALSIMIGIWKKI
jgi:hypothetical protein